MTSRREFIQKSVLAGIGISLLGKSSFAGNESVHQQVLLDGKYVLPPLPYDYNALEPWIDEQTMMIHHDKHHQGYVDGLNKALQAEKEDNAAKAPKKNPMPDPMGALETGDGAPEELSIWSDLGERFKTISTAPVGIRNHGGGHWNHSFFWEIMKPASQLPKNNTPSGSVAQLIDSTFGSFEKFKEQFTATAMGRFGSGWAWLVHSGGKLVITSTANQDNPLMDVAEVKGRPILGLDVWEHAYYLKHQNLRTDYIKSWWNVVDWTRVNKHFTSGM